MPKYLGTVAMLFLYTTLVLHRHCSPAKQFYCEVKLDSKNFPFHITSVETVLLKTKTVNKQTLL